MTAENTLLFYLVKKHQQFPVGQIVHVDLERQGNIRREFRSHWDVKNIPLPKSCVQIY